MCCCSLDGPANSCEVAELELLGKAAKCLVLMLNSIKCEETLKV